MNWPARGEKMDVLSYWNPGLDESEFHQGDLSASFWAAFMDFVRLCHAVKHWGAEKTEARRMARSVKNGGWEKSALAAENHEMRARYLAAEFLRDSAGLAAAKADNALRQKILTKADFDPVLWDRRQWGHEQANFAQFAISDFKGSL